MFLNPRELYFMDSEFLASWQCSDCCLYVAVGAQMPKKTPTAAPNRSDFSSTVNQHCYPHAVNGCHNRCLSRSQSVSVGFSVDVARSATQPCGRYLLALLTRNKEGSKKKSKVNTISVPELHSF